MSNEYDFAWINENRLLDPRVEEDPFARAATRIRDAAVNQRIARPVRGEAVNKLTSALTSDINRFGNMLYSAATLPRDVITGRSQLPSETGVPGSVPFDSPEGQETFKRVQDLSGLAVGGSIPMVAAKGAARGPVLGTGVVPKEAPVKPVVQENAPIFYSGVEHALESTNLGTSTADQWLGTLKNAKGVKPEELQWTGVEDFLAEKKAAGEKVTRAELQDHIAQNKIEIKEVHKSADVDALDPHQRQQLEHDFFETYEREPRNDAELRQFATEVSEYMEGGQYGNIKYSDYQLPGGRDYGELLLTLPQREGERKLRLGSGSGKLLAKDDYVSSHWDEPNVLAHVRYNTRDIDGKKTLHIEEIQSDWHQQGRKKGYKDGTPVTDAEIIKKAKDFYNNWEHPHGGDWEKLSHAERNKWISEARADFERRSDKVPDAPFKKSWPELSFKRMLRYAAENGYDAISWTPGEAQAARYDLSKHINKVELTHNRDGLGTLKYWTGTGDNLQGREQAIKSKDDLVNLVGKDIADKLYEQGQKNNGKAELSGLELKVGGEGMMRFYDDQMPTIAGKYAKAHGGKVEQKPLGVYRMEERLFENMIDSKKPLTKRWTIESDEGTKSIHDTKEEAIKALNEASPPVHYMELPNSLRDTALRKGFPLFSHGVMLTPVDGNPFEATKEPKE